MEAEKLLESVTTERETLMSAEPEDGKEFTPAELEARYARIAQLRSEEMRLNDELAALRAKGTPELTMDNIARVIEMWTKIPASKIKEEEFKRLAELDQRLCAHVVGQDEAIAAVSAAIRRNRVGISPKHKPVSFIFVGPTGQLLQHDAGDAGEVLLRQVVEADDLVHTVEKLRAQEVLQRLHGALPADGAVQLYTL